MSDSFVDIYNIVNEAGWKENLALGAAAVGLATGIGAPQQAQAKQIHQPSVTQAEEKIDIEKLLFAIKQVESSGGQDTRDRYEPGVAKQLGDRFSKLKPGVQNALKKYGYKRVASSYGPYQILASTAYDLGFDGAPEDLRDEVLSQQYVMKLIQTNVNSSRTRDLPDVVSAYNAGLGRIGKNPGYVNKVMGFYRTNESLYESHSRGKCMDCDTKPTIEVLWANGRGHAWFCDKCFAEWKEKDGKGDICSVKQLVDGEASKKFADNKNPNIK